MKTMMMLAGIGIVCGFAVVLGIVAGDNVAAACYKLVTGECTAEAEADCSDLCVPCGTARNVSAVQSCKTPDLCETGMSICVTGTNISCTQIWDCKEASFGDCLSNPELKMCDPVGGSTTRSFVTKKSLAGDTCPE